MAENLSASLDEIDRILIELEGRGHRQPPQAVPRDPQSADRRGRELRELLRRVCVEQGDHAVFDLSPELTGLEDHLVEVTDADGRRVWRFLVGRTGGWAPHHLEIGADGTRPAAREYGWVRDLQPQASA